MAKNSQSKINKKKRSKKNDIVSFFCLPEPKKKSVNRKKPPVRPKTIRDQATQTKEYEKFNIATVINMEFNNSKCEDNFECLLKDFPSCQDIHGMDFFINRPIAKHIPEKSYLSYENDNPHENKKSDQWSPGYHNKLISGTASITLKDILDEGDSLMPRSQSAPWTQLMQNDTNIFYEQDSGNEQTFWKLYEDSDAGFSNDFDSEDLKIYEYVETTTLLPIGDGITTLTPVKTSTSSFSVHSDFAQPKVLESSSPIEIPPHMPPLPSLKMKAYLPSHSSKLPPSRQRMISENLGYYRKNQFQMDNDNDSNTPFYMKTNATEDIREVRQCPINAYVNNITQRPPLRTFKLYDNCSPKVPENNHFSLDNKATIHYNIQPLTSKGTKSKQISQMSTTF